MCPMLFTQLIFLRSLSVPGLFPNLADLWQIISTLQLDAADVFPGVIRLQAKTLCTRDAPDLGAWYPLIVGLA